MTDKFAKISAFREGRGPEPDPNNPHNPYHLPETDLAPRPMPARPQVEAHGGTWMQGKHTATLPNPIVWNWPGRLTDSLYNWCWNQFHDGDSAAPLVEQLKDRELADLLEAMDGFRLEDLAETGVMLYDAMIDEAQRRRTPKKRIAVDVREAFGEGKRNAEEIEEQLPPLEAPKAMRRFP